jgi:hypothetical protein
MWQNSMGRMLRHGLAALLALLLSVGSTMAADEWEFTADDGFNPGAIIGRLSTQWLSVAYSCNPREANDNLEITVRTHDLNQHFPDAAEVGVKFTWDEKGEFPDGAQFGSVSTFFVGRVSRGSSPLAAGDIELKHPGGGFGDYDQPFLKANAKFAIDLFDVRLPPAKLKDTDFKLHYTVALDKARDVLTEVRKTCRGADGGGQVAQDGAAAEPAPKPANDRWQFYVDGGDAYAAAPPAGGMRLFFSCSNGRPAFMLQVEEGRFPKQLAGLQRVFVAFDIDKSGSRFEFLSFPSKVATGQGLKEMGTAAQGTADVARRMGNAQRNVVVGLSDKRPDGDFDIYNMTEFPVAGSGKAVKAMLKECGVK